MKILVALIAMINCSVSVAGDIHHRCDTFSSTDQVSAPFTIEEIEEESMAEISALRKKGATVPHLPFGYGNDRWIVLKSMVRPGDTIVRYSTDELSWKGRYGVRGVALLRSGCIIDRIVTGQS